jgi:DNA-binding protein HU-beta
MNKTTLIEEVSERLDLTKTEVKKTIDSIFDVITEKLIKGETVRIVGFGEFEIRNRAGRNGVNPKTGEKLYINATKTPSFRAGKPLKDAVKGR